MPCGWRGQKKEGKDSEDGTWLGREGVLSCRLARYFVCVHVIRALCLPTLSFSELLTIFVSKQKGTLAPIQILRDDAREEKSENARMSNFIGAIAIGDLVRSTLGPSGMDKILLSQRDVGPQSDIVITNDGATILKAINLDNPAAKILVDLSRVQDEEVGDGTTSVCVLAAELLREAEQLIHAKLHPQTIVEGYRIAVATAREALLKSSVDHGQDAKAFEQDLLNIARTTLSSKVVSQSKDHFARLCVDAVLRLRVFVILFFYFSDVNFWLFHGFGFFVCSPHILFCVVRIFRVHYFSHSLA